MNTDLSILPECYVDTNLIETLVPPQKGYNHQKGCGTVARRMQGKLKDSFAVGILDKDKKEIRYLREFDLKIDTDGLQLYRHRNMNKHHYLIFIKPAVEQWMIGNAEETGISLQNYGLPETMEALKKITKKQTTKNDVRFKRLFRDLKKSNAIKINTLAKWIRYLRQNAYASDVNELSQKTCCNRRNRHECLTVSLSVIPH